MKSIFYFNTFELPRRAGEMKEYELPFDLTEAIGIDVIAFLLVIESLLISRSNQ